MPNAQPDKLKAPLARAGGKTMWAIVQDRHGCALEDVLRLAEIDRTCAIDEAVAAIRHMLDGRARGKVVIVLFPRSVVR